jgi:hypothetical protein
MMCIRFGNVMYISSYRQLTFCVLCRAVTSTTYLTVINSTVTVNNTIPSALSNEAITLTVRVTDRGGLHVDVILTFMVTEAVEPITVSSAVCYCDENRYGRAVGTFAPFNHAAHFR